MQQLKKSLFFLLIFSSCNLSTDHIRFSLNIENAEIDRMELLYFDGSEKLFIDSLYRKQWANGNRIVMSLSGLYYLSPSENCYIPVYLDKGFDVTVNLNSFNKISYDGKGSEENEYVLRNIYHPLKSERYKGYYMNSKDFLEQLSKTLKPFYELINDNADKNLFWKEAYIEQSLIMYIAKLKYPLKRIEIEHKDMKFPNSYWSFVQEFSENKEAFSKSKPQLVTQIESLLKELKNENVFPRNN